MDFLLDYEKKYWDDLMIRIKNEYGVAGLMGNLDKESGLIPYRKQGDLSPPYTASQNYTIAVDNGTISEDTFVHDSIGYGLAQWTYYTRKQQLYNFHREQSLSIGSYALSLKMLFYELENGYVDTLNVLKTATSIRQASNYVLHNYLKPKDQSEAEEQERFLLSEEIYKKYSGSEPEPPAKETKPMPFWFYCRKRKIYDIRRV